MGRAGATREQRRPTSPTWRSATAASEICARHVLLGVVPDEMEVTAPQKISTKCTLVGPGD